MGIQNVIIILGKRLQGNKLTLEGKSRVDALINHLPNVNPNDTALLFCGGTTNGQTLSESQAMFDYFMSSSSTSIFPKHQIVLEQDSTSTVENIQHGSKALLDSGLVDGDTVLTVTFVSNEYHLGRIFEIQKLMDEQGLLGVLWKKCLALGVSLNIPYQLEEHIAVPYPYHGPNASLFLYVESLTTYRVYLEGVVAGVFARNLDLVRDVPYKLALSALEEIKRLLNGNDDYIALRLLIATLESVVIETHPNRSIKKVREYLAVLDTNLTLLNRYLDPESELNTRWWR
ncbi:YdcF family protein [Vibrio sp. ZSDE26]|uniref:YdcF family protein n=1 Tax=Vibrio amylolyticus TaxID=2847292 RepID=A0A9X1XLF4_9VIBR|nr:YdcF family protein [Vibrio amylolyticus]MCK6264611.1 YdcF family protein [Vibrio amylolyticus]